MKYLPLAIALLSTTVFAKDTTTDINLPVDVEVNKTLKADAVVEKNTSLLSQADNGSVLKTTGEVLVKIEGSADFKAFNKKHNLTITQAYGSFYILKSKESGDLKQVIDELKLMPGVLSATLATANMSIEAQ
jgi:hypothetical protein